ncbi:hypothetical protein M5X11_09160 [Paenibacillus alginolyticus]|uniref:endonuclease/exonuclease/phosphatase family protein n=1 Tax=Paenibacillus alginolyticus TaxID=59839 RepID=UPI0004928130|nr:hypothetical protein [Paenibacillus alginolyticus]MCY9665126.1 hypothetical protein [Paenibacillus alginolyticus]
MSSEYFSSIVCNINNQSFLVTGVHLISHLNSNESKRRLAASMCKDELNVFANKNNVEHKIIMGDFNMNPFELGMVELDGFNAVISKDVAIGGKKTFLGKQYPYLYNPSWHLHGNINNAESVPGTYYYNGEDSIYWYLFDQVVISPSIISRFDYSNFKIITEIPNLAGVSKQLLGGRKRRPNRRLYSDHLPIRCKILF